MNICTYNFFAVGNPDRATLLDNTTNSTEIDPKALISKYSISVSKDQTYTQLEEG